MGIQTEYNPDLTLRPTEYIQTHNRLPEECIPSNLQPNQTYHFLKKGQRDYYLLGEIPLLITKGNNQLSLPIASIIILESTHFVKNNEVWTKGTYQVKELIEENQIKYNGFTKLE